MSTPELRMKLTREAGNRLVVFEEPLEFDEKVSVTLTLTLTLTLILTLTLTLTLPRSALQGRSVWRSRCSARTGN